MLPHKERLDLFPLRTAPPKHGFWMRSKHFSVTHVLNFFKINRNCHRELQYFPPHTYIPTTSDHSLVVILTFRDEEVFRLPLHFHSNCLLGWRGGAELLLFFSVSRCGELESRLPPSWQFGRANFLGDHPLFLKQVSNMLGLRPKRVVEVYILSLCQETKSAYLMDHWVQRLCKMPLSHFHL